MSQSPAVIEMKARLAHATTHHEFSAFYKEMLSTNAGLTVSPKGGLLRRPLADIPYIIDVLFYYDPADIPALTTLRHLDEFTTKLLSILTFNAMLTVTKKSAEERQSRYCRKVWANQTLEDQEVMDQFVDFFTPHIDVLFLLHLLGLPVMYTDWGEDSRPAVWLWLAGSSAWIEIVYQVRAK